MTRLVLVAAAALINPSGQLLVSRRPAHKAMAGYWELPGGKIEPGESPEAAIRREMEEELGVRIDMSHLAPLGFASHAYPEFHLLMPVFSTRQWAGHAMPREGQTIEWTSVEALGGREWVPADLPLLPLLARAMTSEGVA